MIVSGILELPWWGYMLVALGLTHITIIGLTVFLHRHQTHHALDLHPAASHFFLRWRSFLASCPTWSSRKRGLVDA